MVPKKRFWYFLMMLTLLTIAGIFLQGHTSFPPSSARPVNGFGYGGVQARQPLYAPTIKATPTPIFLGSSGSGNTNTTNTSPGSSTDNPTWNPLLQWLSQFGSFTSASDGNFGQLVVGIFETILITPLINAGKALVTAPNHQESILWSTPSDMLYGNVIITGLWSDFSGVAIALSSVILAWNLIKLMMKNSETGYAEAVEFVPRFIFAVGASLLSLHFVEIVIRLNNALCNDTTAGMNAFFIPEVVTKDLGGKVVELFVGALYGLMEFLLFITDAMRMGALGILSVTASLGTLAFATRETEMIGRFWLNTFVSTTFIQFLQVLIIRIGIMWMIPTIAGANPGATLAGLATSCAVLTLALQVPRLVGQASLQSMMNIGRHTVAVVTSAAKIGSMIP